MQPASVGIFGLGYVGLPLAVAFARVLPTVGHDIDALRVQQLQKGCDRNGEATPGDLASPMLRFTTERRDLGSCDVLIIAVPTPVDGAKRPDLGPLRSATRHAGAALAERARRERQGTPIVVYESTVYPGCTEEECIPILEEESGLRCGEGFRVAYSPERLNPGDREHRLETIVKVVAAQDPVTRAVVAALYGRIIAAGTYEAPDIRTAEAAKVIENTQRDLNIALMNELAVLFHRLGLDTQEVLRAASTKWNFLRFTPGLVGGHCIPEDPYYLTHKAEMVGYYPQVILAGRRINDSMGEFVARETVQLLARSGRGGVGARVLLLGVSFKEDVADTRNTRVADIARELAAYGARVEAHDPVAGPERIRALGLTPVADPFTAPGPYDAVVLAVPHRAFRERPAADFLRLLRDPPAGGLVLDVKSALDRRAIEAAGARYWRL